MNLTNQMLSKIGEFFPLQVQNPDEVKRMKVSGMTFDISTYRVEGLGHVSGMIASGFFGLMKMDTLIITPMDVDMPLFSYDRVLAMGNDTLIFELYDTLLGEPDMSPVARVKEKYKDLPDHDLGEHWYDSIKLASSISKKGKKALENSFDAFAEEHFNAYLNTKADQVTVKAEKKELSARYVDGLLSQGGPSTDVFKKELGQEKTSLLFKQVLFGTDL
jgi:hypothetical protein